MKLKEAGTKNWLQLLQDLKKESGEVKGSNTLRCSIKPSMNKIQKVLTTQFRYKDKSMDIK